MGEGHFGGDLDLGELFFLGRVLPLRSDETVGDVVEDGAAEEDGFLLHEADVLAEPAEIELVDGAAVEFDDARVGVVPSLDQTNYGALAGTALAL